LYIVNKKLGQEKPGIGYKKDPSLHVDVYEGG
jgi:hypothetical protein